MDERIRVGRLEINLSALEVRDGGEIRKLEPRAAAVLERPLAQRGQVVSREELKPITSRASARSTAAVARCTRSAGTLSPNMTTSGLRMPPQASQSGTSKRSSDPSARPASPSGLMAVAFVFHAGLAARSRCW